MSTVTRKGTMQKLKARGLHEHVIDEIGQRIVRGEFPQGQPLPGEAQLCEGLGVSRTALREALRVLASKGLVEPKRKLGTIVRPSEHWTYLDPQILSWLLEAREADRVIDELYELRHIIEPIAAALAARNAKSADVALLRSAYADMEAAGDDGEKIIEPDLKFHRAIIGASGNRLFSSLAHLVGAALSVNFGIVRDAPRGQRHSMPMHRRVLDAIVDQDASAARVAMQKLIEDSQRDARAVRRAKSTRGAATQSRKAVRGKRA
jgi:DNA-binding FadR family transcriptional regulator